MRCLLVALVCFKICADTCRDLGYEYCGQDSLGCICGEHVDSLRVISNFTLKYVSGKKSESPAEDSRPERSYPESEDW